VLVPLKAPRLRSGAEDLRAIAPEQEASTTKLCFVLPRHISIPNNEELTF